MRFERFMSGRGTRGYGFQAATQTHPQRKYMTIRDSDTGATDRYVAEILTVAYEEIGAAGSFHLQEGRGGYTDIFFPTREPANEWRAVMDNPGRLLYLPWISSTNFLKYSDIGNKVLLDNEAELNFPLPAVPQNRYVFHVEEDMLADMVADVWYAAFHRLYAPDKASSWPLVRIQLTDESNAAETLDMGRAFYTHILMPALPQPLRRIVSVSVGAHYHDAASRKRGGPAAVIIPLPGDRAGTPEAHEAFYDLTAAHLEHKSLNPMGDAALWRRFGHAVLHFAQGGTEDATGTDTFLNAFFLVTQQLPNTPLSANWPLAFMFFYAHTVATSTLKESDDVVNDSFDKNVWDVLTDTLLKDVGLDEQTARSCRIWLERDVVRALRDDHRLRLDQERYETLFRLAFTLEEQAGDHPLAAELSTLYDEVLNRDADAEDGTTGKWLAALGASEQLDQADAHLRERLTRLMERALDSGTYAADEQGMRVLERFARLGQNEARIVTDYAARYARQGCLLRLLRLLRPVQAGQRLDEAVLARVTSPYEIEQCMQPDTRREFKAYADAQPADEAMPAAALMACYAAALGHYVEDHAETMRDQLSDVERAFEDLQSSSSEEAMAAFCALMDEDAPLAESDVPVVAWVLSNGGDVYAQRMAKVIESLFDKALPGMLNDASAGQVIDRRWLDCLDVPGAETAVQKNLRDRMIKTLNAVISADSEAHRGHLAIVSRAFADLGADAENSYEAMDALCACLEASDAPLTMEDAKIILPVLRSERYPALTSRMSGRLTALFELSLESIVRADGDLEDPWLACLSGKTPSAGQTALRAGLLTRLRIYMQHNAVDLSDRTQRMMALFAAFEDPSENNPDSRLNVFCQTLELRADYADGEVTLTRNDLEVLRGGLFRGLDEASAQKLTAVLEKMFRKDLSLMVQDEDSRSLWKECLHLSVRSVGDMLQKRAASVTQEYVTKHAAELYDEPAVMMRVCKDFGATARQSLEGWYDLLDAGTAASMGVPVLSEALVQALSPEMLREMDSGEMSRLMPAFCEDMQHLARSGAITMWEALQKKLPGPARKTFDELAQRVFVAWTAEHAADRDAELLTGLLETAERLHWNKSDAVRDAILGYLKAQNRDHISLEEMEKVLALRVGGQIELGGILNDIFARSLPQLLSGDTGKAAVWKTAVQNSINLKETFERETDKLIAAQAGQPSVDEMALPLIDLGRSLGMLSSGAEQAIKIIAARDRNEEAFLRPGEQEALLQAVVDSRSRNVTQRYVELLNHEPSDPENAAREQKLRADMADIRRMSFGRMDREMSKTVVQAEVWCRQIAEAILERLRSVTAASNGFPSLCEVPGRWENERGDLTFVDFADFFTYKLEASQLQEACRDGAQDVISRATFTELNQQQLPGNWYGELLGELITQRLSSDAETLATQCDSPATAVEMRRMFAGLGNQQMPVIAALDFLLKGNGNASAESLFREVDAMPAQGRKIMSQLLRKVVLGQTCDRWQSIWINENRADELSLAALSCLSDDDPAWPEFLDIVFRNASTDKAAAQSGATPEQAAIFAARVLTACGQEAQAEALAEQISACRSDMYQRLRGAGLRGKKLLPLKEEANWKATGLPASLHRVLFSR